MFTKTYKILFLKKDFTKPYNNENENTTAILVACLYVMCSIKFLIQNLCEY